MAIRSNIILASQLTKDRKLLTFLATRKLGTLAADLGIKAIRQRLDEVEDVGVTTRGFDLFLGYFICRLDRTEENVKANSSRVKCRLLRDQSNLLAVVLDVQLGDLLAIELLSCWLVIIGARNGKATHIDFASERIVEALDKLNDSGFSTS